MTVSPMARYEEAAEAAMDGAEKPLAVVRHRIPVASGAVGLLLVAQWDCC